MYVSSCIFYMNIHVIALIKSYLGSEPWVIDFFHFLVKGVFLDADFRGVVYLLIRGHLGCLPDSFMSNF